MSENLTYRIQAEDQGQRLDRVLARVWPDLTRSKIQTLIKAGLVRLDGRAVKSSEAVTAGHEVLANVPDPAPSHLVPETRALAILYEDDDVLVLDKPAGLVVHPGAGVRGGTLVHALLGYFPGLAGVGGASRPGLVHRLDKDTSGLMVVAKSAPAFQKLTEDLALRKIARRYLALVWRVPQAPTGRIEAAIGRDPKDRTRMTVRPSGSRGARPAATRWRVVAQLPADAARARYALLCVTLETGRTHQIRAHLSHKGHPVVADTAYGGGVKKALSLPPAERKLAQQLVTELGRQALHAAELEFRHPIHGEVMKFTAPLPEDLSRALALLGLSTRPSCS